MKFYTPLPGNRRYNIFYYAVIIVTMLGAVGWLAATFMYSDDFQYSRTLPVPDNDTFWDCRGDDITSADGVWTSMVNHFVEVNGRLPNLLMFPMQLLPRPLVMALAGVLIGLWLWTILLAGAGRNRPGRLWWPLLGAALIWLAMPWYDSYQSMAYQYNYVPASVLMTYVGLMSARAGDLTRRQTVLAALAAFVAGWCHEGFATVTIALIFFMALQHRAARGKLAIICGAAVVALAIGALSGTMHRIGVAMDNLDDDGYEIRYLLTRYISQMWPLWLAAVLLAVGMLRSNPAGRRRILADAWPWMAASVIGLTQSLVLSTISRTLWPAQACAVVAIMVITARTWPARDRLSRTALVAAWAALSLYALWFVGINRVERHVADQQATLYRSATVCGASRGQVIFADLDYETIPFWTVRLTTNDNYRVDFFSSTLADYFAFPESQIIIAPSCYRNVPYDEWGRLPGANRLRGEWPWIVGDTIEGTPMYIEGTLNYLRLFRFTYGDPTPSMTPIERAALAIKRMLGVDTEHVNLKGFGEPITIDGVTRMRYTFEEAPRGLAHRAILSVDTVPGVNF